jgi:hypothetical protein
VNHVAGSYLAGISASGEDDANCKLPGTGNREPGTGMIEKRRKWSE